MSCGRHYAGIPPFHDMGKLVAYFTEVCAGVFFEAGGCLTERVADAALGAVCGANV